MKVNGGPWNGHDVDVPGIRVGLALYDRPANRVWVYDVVPTPEGTILAVRENDGRRIDSDKMFDDADDANWLRRVVDNGHVTVEVGL